MTIPNTLAALPSSQYATAFCVVFGKNLGFDLAFDGELALMESAAALSCASGEASCIVPTDADDCDLNARRNGVCLVDVNCAFALGVIRGLMALGLRAQGGHWKKWRDKLGAARRKSAAMEAFEAIDGE